MRHLLTPEQTVGPFWHIGLPCLGAPGMADARSTGQRVTIAGRVLDGDRQGVGDALLEIWQADSRGKYAHPDDMQDLPADPHFRGFGRFATNERGEFQWETIRPGAVHGSGSTLQAPHLLISVYMRGLLKRLVTRLYFPDEPRNADDPVLRSVPPQRKATLIARAAAAHALEWNVLLQGDDETVFFNC